MILPVQKRVDTDASVVECLLRLSVVMIQPREALLDSADEAVGFYSPSQAAGEEVTGRIRAELVA
jgi:hypothetical protein